MSKPKRPKRPAKAQARSRVSNGRALFLGEVDQRSGKARRYRDVYNDLTADLGGDLSVAKDTIVRRVACLAIVLEQCESELVAGTCVLNIAEYCTASNTLRRLLQDLGLERHARDISPSLQSYLVAKSKPNQSES